MSLPAIHAEKVPSWRRWFRWYIGLAGLFFFNLGVSELKPREALVATVAYEMRQAGDLLQTTVHGQRVDALPLYSWFLSAFGENCLNTWIVRLPAALAIILMGLVAARTAAEEGGKMAGMIAGFVPLSIFGTFFSGTVADNDCFFALFTSCAWFWWYSQGRIKRRWGWAWMISLAFVLLAFFAGGLKAFAYFYLPILLLRRPVRGLRRMGVPGHFLALFIVLAIIGWWIHSVQPEHLLFPTTALMDAADDGGAPTNYLIRLAGFLAVTGLLLFPWIFMTWPAFCLAYKSVDPSPPLSQYLRTVILSIFMVSWLFPGISVKALLPLLSPVAVLIGLNYDILVRRQFRQLRRLRSVIALLVTITASAALLFGFMHITGFIKVANLPLIVWFGMMISPLLTLFMLRWLSKRVGRPFWQHFVIFVAALRIVYSGFWVPLDYALAGTRAREAGTTLSVNLPDDAIVYKLHQRPLLAECYYLCRPVRKIPGPSALPGNRLYVYVLGGEKPPIHENWSWKPSSQLIVKRSKRTPRPAWFPGGHSLLRLEAATVDYSDQYRMYIGTRRSIGGAFSPADSFDFDIQDNSATPY